MGATNISNALKMHFDGNIQLRFSLSWQLDDQMGTGHFGV